MPTLSKNLPKLPEGTEETPKGKGKPTKLATPKKPKQKASGLGKRQVIWPEVIWSLRCVGGYEIAYDKETGLIIRDAKGNPTTRPCGPITRENMQILLGWEDEDQYCEKVKAETGVDPKKEDGKSPFPDDIAVFKDTRNKWVACWNNTANRPLDAGLMKAYAQEHRKKRWAGPTNLPGLTVNGEQCIVGQTGLTLSMQHRGIGFLWFCQEWDANTSLRKTHPEEPVFETSLIFGISEDQKVVDTIDNVKARSLMDTYFTSDLFRDLSIEQRKECCRSLDWMTDFLWSRTGAGKVSDAGKARDLYQTNAEAWDFMLRHDGDDKRMGSCVRHITGENKDRAFSALRLSAGHCAGMMYLMAVSACSRDNYEYKICGAKSIDDWTGWDKAKAFWTQLAKEKTSEVGVLKPLRTFLRSLIVEKGVTEERGNMNASNLAEKVAAIAKAWKLWESGEMVNHSDDDGLTWLDEFLGEANEEGERRYTSLPSFGGIDLGVVIKEEKESPEAKKIREEADKERKEAENRDKIKAKLLEMRKKKEADAAAPPVVGSGEFTRPMTRKEIEAKQTSDAKKADEDAEKETQEGEPEASEHSGD